MLVVLYSMAIVLTNLSSSDPAFTFREFQILSVHDMRVLLVHVVVGGSVQWISGQSSSW